MEREAFFCRFVLVTRLSQPLQIDDELFTKHNILMPTLEYKH